MAVEIQLLGGFAVSIDGDRLPDAAWTHSRPRDLLQLLALAPRHRLPSEQVLEALWPNLDPTPARANLHKAAHLTRRATGRADAVVLSLGLVELFPGSAVTTDVATFEDAAREAIRRDDAGLCRAAADRYPGDLLPDQPYPTWAEDERRRLRRLLGRLLGRAGDHEQRIDLDPLDEDAHLRVMQDALDRGSASEALRCYARLAQACRSELGSTPGDTARALRDEAARRCVPSPQLPPLVGRDAELTALRRLLLRAQNGQGGCVLVEGEAGLGKTRLTEELVAEAVDAGWPVARLVGDPAGSAPYLPVLRGLRRLLQQRPDLADPDPGTVRARLEELTTHTGSALALSASHDGHTEDLVRVVADLLVQPGFGCQSLLVLDDAHTADVATLELVWRLAQICLDEPLVVAVSYRPPSPSSALHLLRGRLLRREALRLRLSPLSSDAAADLVRRSARHEPTEQTTRDLVRLGEGNPFLLQELGGTVQADGTGATVGLDDVVIARLGTVSGEAAVALQRVAVVHMSCTLPEFAAAAGVDERAGARLVDECVQRGILVQEAGVADGGDGATTYTFRHALVRDSFAGLVPPDRHRVLHGEEAARLVAAGAEPGRVAHHLERSEEPAAATPLLLQAGLRAAAAGAFGDARRLAERGLRHGGRPETLALRELRADCLQALGDPAAATAYTAVRRASPSRDTDRLLVKQAHAFLTVGDVDGADACLASVSPEPPADEEALVLLARGLVAWFRGQLDISRQLAAEARHIALREARAFEAGEALLLDALVSHSTGDWRLARLPQVMRDLTVPELISKAWDPHLCIGIHLVGADEPFDEVAGFLRDAATNAQRRRAVRGEAFARTVLGGAAVYAGHADEAAASLHRALQLQRRCGSSAGQSIVLERMGALAHQQGEPSRAEQLLEDSERMARSSTLTSHLLARVHATRIEGAASGEEARALVDRAEEDLRGARMCHGCSPLFLLTAAGACLQAGQLERAARFLEAARTMGPAMQVGVWAASICELEAGMTMARGGTDRAADLLARAERRYRGCGHLVAADRCRRALQTAGKDSGRPSS